MKLGAMYIWAALVIFIMGLAGILFAIPYFFRPKIKTHVGPGKRQKNVKLFSPD